MPRILKKNVEYKQHKCESQHKRITQNTTENSRSIPSTKLFKDGYTLRAS